jgi:hypothetical protein
MCLVSLALGHGNIEWGVPVGAPFLYDFTFLCWACAGPVQGASDLPALGECHLEV